MICGGCEVGSRESLGTLSDSIRRDHASSAERDQEALA